MNLTNATTGFNVRSHRAALRRSKDAHFDALCETYLDLGHRITKLTRSHAADMHDIDALKDQRENCLDTIMFMLDDDRAPHPAQLH